MTMKTTVMLTSCFFLSSVRAQVPHELLLYDHGVPNSLPAPNQETRAFDGVLRVFKVSVPTMTVYLPEKAKATGAAVIICPGGGYGLLALGHEGADVAEAFVKQGIAGIVLKYRLPDSTTSSVPHTAPLQDAQQAILQVRRHAMEWNIRPDKVGILGFSSGGHLASTAGTHFAKAYVDTLPGELVRPDFMLLIYPVISLEKGVTHEGSVGLLFGTNVAKEQRDLFSNEKHVTTNTPPAFLVHAANDEVVPVQNSLRFVDALQTHKVKVELHVFPEGGHGFGLNNPTTKIAWFDLCVAWIQQNIL